MTAADKFEALTHPKPGAKMTTRCPRKAAKVCAALIKVAVPPYFQKAGRE